MLTLTLIRGLPGSGKSTLARALKANDPGLVHLEADMFRTESGRYVFRPERNKQVHELCQKTTRNMLRDGLPVVVANTFVKLWELAPYRQMALEIPNVTLQVIECHGLWPNVHGVPPEVIDDMRYRWERLPADFIPLPSLTE